MAVSAMTTYKNRLYETYVSGGQSKLQDTGVPPEKLLSPRRAYLRRIISKHIPKGPTTILDLGCGYGAFLYFLSRAGYKDISGVDGSAEQVAMAHRLGIHQVEQADIQAFLGYSPSFSVDVILLMDVLEHLTGEDLFATLDQVLRVLRPGGRCIAHVPNAEGLFGMRIRYGDFTHEQAFTRSSVEQIFHTVGFSDVRCFEDKPIVHSLTSAIRRIFWVVGTLPFRLLLAAESPPGAAILSQGMLLIALK